MDRLLAGVVEARGNERFQMIADAWRGGIEAFLSKSRALKESMLPCLQISHANSFPKKMSASA